MGRLLVGFAAVAVLLVVASPARAIEPGCYPADVVRAATWDAEGPDRQFTLLAGNRPVDDKNANVITTNADGSLGYNLESDPKNGKICVALKFTDARFNMDAARPAWVHAPRGSFVDTFLNDQNRKIGITVIFGATTILRGKDGRDYAGRQILVTMATSMVGGTTSGYMITNDGRGNGDRMLALMDFQRTSNFDRMLAAQPATTRPSAR